MAWDFRANGKWAFMAKQMIQVDINADNIPPAVKDLQPIFYRDGDEFRVVESDTPGRASSSDESEPGIVGVGATLAAAMDDFQQKYEAEKENSL